MVLQGGEKAYEVTYRDGNKTGLETYWSPEGHIIWQWDRSAGGIGIWTHYWPNGKKKQQSDWHGEVANGPAVLWDRSGRAIGHYQFKDGVIVK